MSLCCPSGPARFPFLDKIIGAQRRWCMTWAWISVSMERQVLLRDLAQVTSSPYWSSLKNKQP